VHEFEKERLVAVCDAEVCGKSILHNGVKLKIQDRFYGDQHYTSDEVLIEVSKCTSLNAFGKNICELLIKHNIVHPATVLWIEEQGEKFGHVIVVQ
jgi:hypothetical protein